VLGRIAQLAKEPDTSAAGCGGAEDFLRLLMRRASSPGDATPDPVGHRRRTQIRRAVRHAFEAAGVKVVEAPTRQGIDLAASERPDLIVSAWGSRTSPVWRCAEVRKWSTRPSSFLRRHLDAEKVALPTLAPTIT
jgi:hypothetical protein